MRLHFTARGDDTVACKALSIIESLGCTTQILQSNAQASAGSIALFSIESDVRNRFLRLSKYRMAQENIAVPDWASNTPFCVAISAPNVRAYPYGLRNALGGMVKNYHAWGPWMRRPEAPWSPRWRKTPHTDFPTWLEAARDATAQTSRLEKLSHRLRPIFTPTSTDDITTLIVTGCALFNKPHTDVVDLVTIEKKRDVVQGLEQILHDADVSDARFVVPRSDLLRSEMRDHFHPFVFMDVGEVSKYFGSARVGSARLFGKQHYGERTDAEVALALERSGDGIVREIVAPLADAARVDIASITWTDYVGDYVEKAYVLAQKHRDYAESIYLERVKTRPSYATLHKMDPERGLRRTLSNNVFYIAEAMFLKDNPGVAVVNCEFADTFWRGLEPLLANEVWGEFRPFIGMVPENMRQPWGY